MSPPREVKKETYVQKTSEKPQTETIKRRQPGCKKKRKAANRDKWRHLMREAKARKGL
jgi:hypothetical protein